MGFMVVDLMGSCLMTSFHRAVLELGFSVGYLVIGNRIRGWESRVDHPVGQLQGTGQSQPSGPIHRRIQLNEARSN